MVYLCGLFYEFVEFVPPDKAVQENENDADDVKKHTTHFPTHSDFSVMLREKEENQAILLE